MSPFCNGTNHTPTEIALCNRQQERSFRTATSRTGLQDSREDSATAEELGTVQTTMGGTAQIVDFVEAKIHQII